MVKKVALVIFSVLALLGAFLPIASGGNFYVNISHLKGLAYLLYAIPLILLVLSVVNIYKDVKYIKIWFISTSILGLLILLYSTAVGINFINYIIRSTPSAKPGLGAYLMGLGFLGVFGLNLISIRKKQ
jgi:hypothetical protein